jgi:hypothetical protein
MIPYLKKKTLLSQIMVTQCFQAKVYSKTLGKEIFVDEYKVGDDYSCIGCGSDVIYHKQSKPFFQHSTKNGCDHFKTNKTASNSDGKIVPPEGLAGMYTCVSCKRTVLLKLNVAHFSHKTTTKCAYLNRDWNSQPESVLHKMCKELLKRRLDEGMSLNVKCEQCNHEVFNYTKQENDVLKLEYTQGKDSPWIADVAITRHDALHAVLEVKVTHTTTTPRPEPWYEFDAKEMYPALIAGSDLNLVCCRKLQPYNRCSKCTSTRTISYAGVQFDSTLEAQWAAFFDLVGWKWEYKKAHSSGWTPTFMLRGTAEFFYIEVQPFESRIELWKDTQQCIKSLLLKTAKNDPDAEPEQIQVLCLGKAPGQFFNHNWGASYTLGYFVHIEVWFNIDVNCTEVHYNYDDAVSIFNGTDFCTFCDWSAHISGKSPWNNRHEIPMESVLTSWEVLMKIWHRAGDYIRLPPGM